MAVRAAVWVGASMAGAYLVQNPTPSSAGDLTATLPFDLIFTIVPGGLFLFLVRTWTGTILGSIGFVAAWIGLFLYISKESEKSSTAGIAVLALPFVLMVPVIAIFAWEQMTMPATPKPLPPPPA